MDASRVVACARLSLARAQERQRASQQPIVVSCRETRTRDGRVVVSLCSSEEEEDDSGEDDEQEEKREDGARFRPGAGAYIASPLIKKEHVPDGRDVLDVESDGWADEDMAGGASSNSDDVDVDLTGDTDGSEGGESGEGDEEQVKTEMPARDDDVWVDEAIEVAEPEEDQEEALKEVETAAPVVAMPHRPATVSASEWCVRKMDEVDAAFLLFYGERETPSASVLGMIIDLIAAGVGATDAYLARFVKHAAWRKLNAAVDAGVRDERAVQSEWMKIVFEEEPPRHRRRWGPMSRMPLLARPVQITVRSMQFAGGPNPLQSQNSARGRATVASKTPKRSAKKELSGNKRKLLAGVHVVAKGGLPPRMGSSVKQGTATKRPLADLSGSSPTVSASPSVASPPFTPRKHHRRNGSASPLPVTPRQILRAKGPGGHSISHDLMQPLPSDIRTLGDNRSLPGAWGEKQVAEFRRSTRRWPVDIDPLGHMTVGQLADHIKSVRRESRIENFDHASEILSKLMTHPRNDRGLFNVPVDPIALGLQTYTTVVKHPMDLGTVKGRLARGEYVEMEALAADVRLVFENAMLFNNKDHYVHVNASVLLQLFENAMRGERERQSRRTKPSRHICLVCRGNQCSMCQQHCLAFSPPHLQCAGGCSADFRKGSIYFATRDGTRVYCQKCKSRMDKESDGGQRRLSFSQATMNSSGDGTGSSQSSQATTEDPVAPENLIKHKVEVGVEPWVRCTDCNKWLHQVCGLFNPVLGVYAREHKYVCPLCHWRWKSAAQSAEEESRSSRPLEAPSPSWDEAVNGIDAESPSSVPSPAMDATSGESTSSAGSAGSGSGYSDSNHWHPDPSAPADDCAWASGENIPSCELSDFVQSFLARELRAVGEHSAADSLYVRALSFPHERMSVSDAVVNAFAANSDALAQLRPEASARAAAQRLPSHASYLSRGLYLFQKHDGVDVCLFTLYTQEFGDACELVANRRSVYIAYLDSVRYLSPPSARTAAYHLLLLAYFDYIRRHGFRTVHIWSCPPQKRTSYVFWCRPPFQKTPSADHLRLWYKNLLEKAKTRQIVAGWTTTFDRYFSVGESETSNSTANETAGIATRGVTARSVDPGELEWPVPRLPPLFDGDLVPAELDRVLGRIAARNDKASRAASASPFYGKGGAGSSGGKRVTLAGDAVKLEPGQAVEPGGHVTARLREVFDKCQQAVRNLRHDLLVVDLAADTESDARVLPCRPEALAPAWCARVPRFFGSRFMFHQLCSRASYQFDSLRRAKHSTLMLLHHYFLERAAVQANVFCRECSLLITHADYWACGVCDRLALCDACHRRVGHRHEHPMRFGQPSTTPLLGGRNQQTESGPVGDEQQQQQSAVWAPSPA